MKLIERNPYRILGLTANSSAKDIRESEIRLKRYLEVGENAKLKLDLSPPLKDLKRTEALVSKTKNLIHNDKDKVLHAFYWFVKNTPVDDFALKILTKEKNLEAALSNFSKGCRNFNLSKTSFSAILNHSTLDIISYIEHKDESRVKLAIQRKFAILNNNEAFLSLEKLITGNERKINISEFSNLLFQQTKELLKNIFPRRNHQNLLLDIFKVDEKLRNEIEEQIIKDIISSINIQISSFGEKFASLVEDKSDNAVIRAKKTILNIGKDIISMTKTDLNKLKKIVGSTNYQYTKLVDNVYTLVNYTVIAVYNKEMDKLNNAMEVGAYSTILSTNFTPYVKLLSEASKDLAGVDCSIKSTLNNNLAGVIKVQGQLADAKSQIRRDTSSYRRSPTTYTPTYSEEGMPAGAWFFIIFVIIVIASTCN